MPAETPAQPTTPGSPAPAKPRRRRWPRLLVALVVLRAVVLAAEEDEFVARLHPPLERGLDLARERRIVPREALVAVLVREEVDRPVVVVRVGRLAAPAADERLALGQGDLFCLWKLGLPTPLETRVASLRERLARIGADYSTREVRQGLLNPTSEFQAVIEQYPDIREAFSGGDCRVRASNQARARLHGGARCTWPSVVRKRSPS